LGKPGVTKDVQIVLVSDAYRNRPRAYLHRHKCCHAPIAGFTRQGPMEVHMIMEDMLRLVKGEEGDGRHQIFVQDLCDLSLKEMNPSNSSNTFATMPHRFVTSFFAHSNSPS
jgi:hypothetical protein